LLPPELRCAEREANTGGHLFQIFAATLLRKQLFYFGEG
jgi:hypothetical protein